jgi:transposase
MSHKTAAAVAPTIGIDTGKNTLHLIGLDLPLQISSTGS